MSDKWWHSDELNESLDLNDCQMTNGWLPNDDCLMTARWLPDDCLMNARWLSEEWIFYFECTVSLTGFIHIGTVSSHRLLYRGTLISLLAGVEQSGYVIIQG